MIEPPSFNSSRSTEVITACFTFISMIASATRFGSCKSAGKGFPVATAQNPQLRVQIFPSIMKVAVPSPQHSPMLGQLPLSQIVCNLCVSTICLTCLYSSPIGSFTRSQFGLRGFSAAGKVIDSLIYFVFKSFKKQRELFSLSEDDGHITVEEKLFFFIVNHLRDFLCIEFSVQTHFNCRDHFVITSIIKPDSCLCINARCYSEFIPSFAKIRATKNSV